MKIERLKCFADEVSKDHLVQGLTTVATIFYFFEDTWYDINGNEPTTVSIADLDKSKKRKGHWRHPSSTRAYFFIPELDAVVVAEFFSAPTESTRAHVLLALSNCFTHAENAFRAAHDSLTELLNRHSLERILVSTLAEAPTTIAPPVEELSTPQQVAVLSFDIDHFKQLNDTYGHVYGDMVLRCFAQRLERIANDISSQFGSRLTFHVTRPGGEEFTIIEKGNLSDEEICQIAERFREGISHIALPDKEEWLALKKRGLADGIELPPERERTVTCSVGVVSAGIPVPVENSLQTKNILVNRADLALYRAKASGRDTTCFFPEILKRYGRVMEFHAETGIVTIDLGNEVGVRRGQEFLVYHPQFTGSTDFIFRDGRTAKKMGQYPRLATARLEVFDVQKEIGFCKVLERTPNDAPIVEKAWLEAVPLGSIAHLVTPLGTLPTAAGSAGTGLVVGTEQLRSRLAEIIGDKKEPFVAVFRISNEESVTEEVGIARINRALASLYEATRQAFPVTGLIGATSPTQLAVVVPNDKAGDYVSRIKTVLGSANQSTTGRIRFVAGVFDPTAIQNKQELWGQSNVDFSRSLEFADYASTVEGPERNQNLQLFNTLTLSNMFTSLEKERKHHQALEDYKKLIEYGLKSAWLENHGSRIAFYLRDYERAYQLITRAIEMDSSKPMYLANLGVVEFKRENYKDAYMAFKRAIETGGFEVPDTYIGPYAISAFWTFMRGEGQITQEQLLGLLEGATTLDLPNPFVAKTELIDAIKSIHVTPPPDTQGVI